jgi:hypothetical protein
MTEHVSAACALHQLLDLLECASSSANTVVLCDQIALACRTLCKVSMQEDRQIAEDESGRPFPLMIGVASADQRGGVSGHGSLTGFGGGDHSGLQLGLFGGHFTAGLDGGAHGKEGVFGGTLSGLSLADFLEGHGCQ